jgi:endoglucanase
MRKFILRFLTGLFCLFSFHLSAVPFYVDLKSAATSNIEDDGFADNGKGGWTDEGINDMYTFPPVPLGDVTRNGYHFHIIDPAKNNGKSVIILKGLLRARKSPEEVTLKVPDVKGKYVYFLQNAAADVKEKKKHYLVAEYSVAYADGSTVKIPIRNGEEIHQWWSKEWWKNAGEKSWPIHMGANHYSMKWKMFLGIWAMQWTNPHPDKAIKSITLKSMEKSVPIIWAVTIDNDNYYKSSDIKKDYKCPPSPPAGYFEKKLAQENKRLFESMERAGMAKGVRRLQFIKPDLLALTIDASVSGGAGMGEKKAAALQNIANFAISSKNDPAYKKAMTPGKVGRQSFMYNTVTIGDFPNNNIFWHTYYLKLSIPLKNGKRYKISVKGLKAPRTSISITYNDSKTKTPSIKVNQQAYSSKVENRYAYLGWWAGSLGPVDFSTYKRFEVINDKTGRQALSGAITLRRGKDTKPKKEKFAEGQVSGEDLYEMDLSKLKVPGKYHIYIEKLGCSDSFGIGGKAMQKAYYTTMRGFLYQRCGIELGKETGYPHPACHLKNYESGNLVCGVNEKYKDGKPVVVNQPLNDNDPIKEFRGGYHDAGDFDLFYGHLIATSKILVIYEAYPKLFKDKELDLPESGNKIPDMLDEAIWGLKFYADNQEADGAIFSGRGHNEDYANKEWQKEFKSWKEKHPEWKKYDDLPPYSNFFPCNASANTFAAVASQLSRVLKKTHPKLAAEYLKKAKKAYEWGEKHQKTGYEQEGITYVKIPWKTSWAWAAAELFKTTGKEKYNITFKGLYKNDKVFKLHWSYSFDIPLYQYAYASCRQPGADNKIKEELKKRILKTADGIVKSNDLQGYRMGTPRTNGSWGQLCGGGRYAMPCILAYLLTKDSKYAQAAAINADFQLGANPLSRSFITGLGARPPEHPEVRYWLYNKDGIPSPGVPVFGPASSVPKLKGTYPAKIPLWRCWLDNRLSSMHSEFAVGSSTGNSAMLYAFLWALENK